MSSLFKGLKRQLDGLQNPQTLHDLHNIAGRATHELVLQGFQREASPDGSPWAPTRRRNPILQDTLALRDGIQWKADSRGLVIQTSGRANRYAAYHQRGTRRLPRREFLPEAGVIPPAYEARLRNEFRAYFKERFG